MSETRICRHALTEVETALETYRKLLADREHAGALELNTRKTYLLHAENFVRWLRGEFDPGARNQP